MPNGKVFRICFMMILFVILLNFKGIVLAGDCKDCQEETGGATTPTSAGNAIIQPGWNCNCIGAKPTIIASSETIVKGGSITLSVTGGCPPYTWSTSSKGYSLTYNKDGTVTLSCTTGTCGTNYDVYATIKVTDNCGQPADIVIRNTAGTWSSAITYWSIQNPNDTGGCGSVNCGCGYTHDWINCSGAACAEVYTVGHERWCVGVPSCNAPGPYSPCADPPTSWAWADAVHNPPCGDAGACYYGSSRLQNHNGVIGKLRYLYETWTCP